MGQPEDVRKLTVRDMLRGIERLHARIQDLKEFDPDAVTVDKSDDVPELTALSDSIQRTLENLFGENTVAFHRFSAASRVRLESGRGADPFGMPMPIRLHHQRQAMRDNIADSVVLLERAIKTLEQDIAEADEKRSELFILKPGLWGINVDLKELFHRCIAFLKGKR
jgi:hypothetical protein